MILQESFPRATVFWILIAQIAVFLPHIDEMPIWVTGLYGACLAWRFGIYQGRWGYPNNWVKLFLIFAGFLTVLASFQTISGSRGGVALLLIAFAFKTLEMKEQRDAYVVVMIAYFVVACGFLYQRTFFSAAYLFLCLVIVSAALVSMNHLPRKSLDFQGLRLAGKMLLQALPLMVFLFMFFPQLPPLFQMNLGAKEASTGLSETMSPGSIAELTRSDELAFRVKFDGPVPAQDRLYWRAQVFERFDGIAWKMSEHKKAQLTRQDVFPLNSDAQESEPTIVAYEIYQETTGQKMLFSLATAWSDKRDIVLNTDYSISRTKKVDKLFYYQIESNLSLKRDLFMDDLTRQRNSSLPVYGNEKARKLAGELRASVASDEAFIEKVLNRYMTEEFEYTLRPPVVGANPIDEFLFETRKGFCEHFATSFVYLMRAGGIPARIVGGYLGGEFNQNGEYLLVHQFDAHAWAEVWLEDRGWVRIDPTAWIAPERVSQGIEQALPEGESILEGNLFSTRRFDPLTQVRLQLDYLNMQWDKWVLGYDEEKQARLLNKILGEVTATRIALFVAFCFALVVFGTALSIYIKDFLRVKDPADRLYLRFQKRLARRRRLRREPGETPQAFAQRVQVSDESLGQFAWDFTRYYMQVKYQREWPDKERRYQLKKMREALREI